MTQERIRDLDVEALDLFARKGSEGGPSVPQAGLANGVKVRRVMQITRDLAGRPFPELRVLDLGCGEGVYAIEAGLRGAEVLALDARTQRMDRGAACAARHGLGNVRFVQGDVRGIARDSLGSFDVVYLLGLLYHLDAPDVFSTLASIRGLCTRMLVIDTLISLTAETQVDWRGQLYGGRRCREHEDSDPEDVRRARVLRSIDNTFSFRLTKESLLRALREAGFSSAFECYVPFEPGKADDRVTLVALAGEPVAISTYPWVNRASELEIERTLRAGSPAGASVEHPPGAS